MSPAGYLGLVLGSSVLGAVLGGYIKSTSEREASFRERLVTTSVDFLASVAKTRDALGHARRVINQALADGGAKRSSAAAKSDDPEQALTAASDAVSALWAMIPLLLVLFPTPDVAKAARALTDALDDAQSRLADDWRRKVPTEFGTEYERIDDLHIRYAEAARRDIRRSAYRSWRLRRRSEPWSDEHPDRRPASPIPPLRYRLLGPRVLQSTRWQQGGR
jgi:hypothetical protein